MINALILFQFSLVCDKKYLGMLSASIFFFGTMTGAIIFGILSDRFGRKKVIIITIIGQIIAGIALSLSPNYISYAVLRFMLGLFTEVRKFRLIICKSNVCMYNFAIK